MRVLLVCLDEWDHLEKRCRVESQLQFLFRVESQLHLLFSLQGLKGEKGWIGPIVSLSRYRSDLRCNSISPINVGS